MANDRIYQLKISLTDSDPLIWRRILISGTTSLEELHRIVQIAMGWQNLSKYHYRIGNQRSDMEPSLLQMPLNEVVRDDLTRFTYVYDLRDGWFHSIEVEMVLPADPQGHYPHCVTGELRCPPEGCGGVWGYNALLEILDDPDHPQYLVRWDEIGGDFDPDHFDVGLVNMQLNAE
ncbi:MAG: plasmid pRiA4b ORF-3 family protein [Leptolyngbyaceae cyanobacterium]